jgi:hypothetical protein
VEQSETPNIVTFAPDPAECRIKVNYCVYCVVNDSKRESITAAATRRSPACVLSTMSPFCAPSRREMSILELFTLQI